MSEQRCPSLVNRFLSTILAMVFAPYLIVLVTVAMLLEAFGVDQEAAAFAAIAVTLGGSFVVGMLVPKLRLYCWGTLGVIAGFFVLFQLVLSQK